MCLLSNLSPTKILRTKHMIINVDKNGQPIEITGRKVTKQEAEAVYMLITAINRKEKRVERSNDTARKP